MPDEMPDGLTRETFRAAIDEIWAQPETPGRSEQLSVLLTEAGRQWEAGVAALRRELAEAKTALAAKDVEIKRLIDTRDYEHVNCVPEGLVTLMVNTLRDAGVDVRDIHGCEEAAYRAADMLAAKDAEIGRLGGLLVEVREDATGSIEGKRVWPIRAALYRRIAAALEGREVCERCGFPHATSECRPKPGGEGEQPSIEGPPDIVGDEPCPERDGEEG